MGSRRRLRAAARKAKDQSALEQRVSGMVVLLRKEPALNLIQGYTKVTGVTPIGVYCESARGENFLHTRQQRKNVASQR